jgi:hypothetical protein
VAISRIQRVSQKTLQKCIPQISNIKKAYHGLKIGPGHTDKSQILMKCNKPTNERQKECEKQKHQLTLITINRMVLKVVLSQDSDEICGISAIKTKLFPETFPTINCTFHRKLDKKIPVLGEFG